MGKQPGGGHLVRLSYLGVESNQILTDRRMTSDIVVSKALFDLGDECDQLKKDWRRNIVIFQDVA